MKNPLIKFGDTVQPSVVSSQIIESIKEGDLDPLHVAVAFKRIQKIMDAVCGTKGDKEVKDAISVETQRYSTKGKAAAFGAMVEYCPTYTKYDYSKCNHPEWDELTRIVRNCKARLKELEGELRKLPPGGEEQIIRKLPKLVQEISAEIVHVDSPTKSQTWGTKIFI